jgi:hypothetical protein
MDPERKNSEMGGGRLRAVIAILVLIAIAYGLYKFVPFAWHGLQSFLHGIRGWWHVKVADPVFGAILYLVFITHGQLVLTVAIIALAHWTLLRINRTISVIGFQKMAKQPQSVQENLIGQMENVQGKLKRLFSDDIEKIALFGGKISGDQPERRAGNPFSMGCLGCLPGMLWSIISVPVIMMVGVAIYDGVSRLFVTPDSVDSLTAFAANRNLVLTTLLPLQDSVLLFGRFTVHLADRSLILTALLAAIGLATWSVNNISTSGWTWPRLVNRYPAFGYIILMALCYVFLNSALLIFASCWATYSLIYTILAKFLFRPFFLRARMAIKPKATSTEVPIEEPASAT